MNFIHVPVLRSDYRGPLGVIPINPGDALFEVVHDAQITQMVVAPVVGAEFALENTARGKGGFGSTGVG